ncbi:zinc ABC transporter substrate-binding protein [Colwelliaceae bacterium BS250]
MALLTIALPAKAELNIFACEPEYAALAKELTLADSAIFSATTALQDPHFVQARPSLISKMRRADLVICAGAELEAGWLPMLQSKSNNRDVQSTTNGLFYASDHVENLDIPVKVDRSMGDVHSLGNPHVHLDPHRIQQLANALSVKLVQLDPENAQQYQHKLQLFTARWQQAIPKWQEQAKPLAGTKVIAYHSTFRYLFDFLNIEQVADLEPKPGMPPTSTHLSSLLLTIEQQQVHLVVYSAYQDDKGVNWLQQKTDVAAVQLPYTIGGNEQVIDLFSMFDQHIKMLTAKLAVTSNNKPEQ